WQLMLVCFLLVLVPAVTVGTLTYNAAKTAMYEKIEDQLSVQSLDWKAITESYVNQVEVIEEREDALVKEQTTAVSLNVKRMFELVYEQYGQNPPADVLEKLYDKVSQIKIGNTGYVAILDREGSYIVSVGRQRDGENLWDSKDDNGRYFVQDMVNEGRRLRNDNVYHTNYPWRNTGDSYTREKLGTVAYFQPWDVLIVSTVYLDELKGSSLKTELMDELKTKISQQRIGDKGYIWVLDSNGKYIVSKDRESDGESVWDSKDSDGVYFAQEMIKNSKTLKEGDAYVHYYPWQNAGESEVLTKMAAVTYVEDWDWVIGSSAYQVDLMDSFGGLSKIRNTTILLSLLSIIAGALFAYIFSSRLSSPLEEIYDVIKTVAEGDLTKKVNLKSFIYEINNLSQSFNIMVEKYRNIIMAVAKNTNSAAADAEELSASAQEVNASIEQVSSTIQGIAKSAQELNKSSSSAADRSKKTGDSAAKGSKAASEVKNKMTSIDTTTKSGSDKVKTLGGKSQKIADILETINNVSEQTNLLALNAAIEAARAGEAGRGFAVVADEVRKLAEESKKATGLIGELLSSIQSEIDSAVQSMDENTKQVEGGGMAVNEALVAFEEIPVLVGQVDKSINEISAIAEQNAAGAEEVSASVEEVTAAVQQVALTAQKLSEGENQLKGIISQFKLGSDNK
ncbi:cache domain-containing protein, partial [Candidatus Woesearchaeota archaeon]|nr:cache domain-containing protein [Candidatus Woesearchaeota archaeon]